jgi:hypothetical protein
VATVVVATPEELKCIQGCAFSTFKKEDVEDLWVGLPTSTSYLKIVDVPAYKGGLKDVMTGAVVQEALLASPLKPDILLWGAPRIVRNSKSSATATSYFNVWDSQSGARAKRLIGKTVFILGRPCQIRAAAANPGAPFCSRCCRWGHPSVQ